MRFAEVAEADALAALSDSPCAREDRPRACDPRVPPEQGPGPAAAFVWGMMCMIWRSIHMRTNIVIDDKLMADALKASGARTKREAVELGLRTLLQLSRQGEIRRLRGKVKWTGDLDAMRRDK